jgi:NitT/TauT family transport system permease protein
MARVAAAAPDRDVLARFALGATTCLAALLLWEWIASSGLINPLFTSSPSRVLRAGRALVTDGTLARHLAVSGQEFAVGYLAAILVGVPAGIALGSFRWLNAAVGPFVSAMYATPRIALMPLFIIWFGLGLTAKVVVVFLSAVFPLIVNMQVAVKTVDEDMVRVATSYGANHWRTFLTITLPASVPFLITGLRLASGRALLGVVAAEVFGGAAGIGYLIEYAGSTFQTDKVFVGVIVVASLGVILDRTLLRLSDHFQAWR